MKRRHRAGIVAIALLCVLAAGCATGPVAPAGGASADGPVPGRGPDAAGTTWPDSARTTWPDAARTTWPDAASVRRASAELGALHVERGGSSVPYDRDAFGPAWADVDRNGCDTRNDVLGRDLAGARLRPGTSGCTVVRGTLVDPYDGALVVFVAGPGTSPLVQIDHVVSLSYAWRHGAAQWMAARRQGFANDPRELLAVSEPMNDAKGPFGPGEWLPPTPRGRCVFVVRWIGVMSRYALTVHPGDRAAAARVLSSC